MGLIKTEEIQEKHSIIGAREEINDKLVSHTKGQLSHGAILHAEGFTNPEVQKGTALTHEQFEKRLGKLNKNLQFEDHPSNPTKRCAYLRRPDGLEYLTVYERGVLPENSVFQEVIKEDLDPMIFSNPKFVIERADLPKHEVIRPTVDESGNIISVGDVLFDERDPAPGKIRRKTAWSEVIRGWRTVLIRMLEWGVITKEATEREFGSSNTRNWAEKLGKRS